MYWPGPWVGVLLKNKIRRRTCNYWCWKRSTKATEVARNMVIEQGMETKLRDQVFHEDGGGMMFDRMVHDRPYSDETAREIDAEVATLMKEAAKRAEIVLKHNTKPLEALVAALLEKETIDEKEISSILKGAVLPKEAALY